MPLLPRPALIATLAVAGMLVGATAADADVTSVVDGGAAPLVRREVQ